MNMSDVHNHSDTSRDDASLNTLINDIFTELLGLSPNTVNKLVSLIKTQNELSTAKQALRSMNSIDFSRLGKILDTSQERISHDQSELPDESNDSDSDDLNLDLHADIDKDANQNKMIAKHQAPAPQMQPESVQNRFAMLQQKGTKVITESPMLQPHKKYYVYRLDPRKDIKSKLIGHIATKSGEDLTAFKTRVARRAFDDVRQIFVFDTQVDRGDNSKEANENVVPKFGLLGSLTELSTADIRATTPDRQTVLNQAKQTQQQVVQQKDQEIKDLSSSDDPEKRNLAMLLKKQVQLAKQINDVRQQIEQKRQQGQQPNNRPGQQPSNQQGQQPSNQQNQQGQQGQQQGAVTPAPRPV